MRFPRDSGVVAPNNQHLFHLTDVEKDEPLKEGSGALGLLAGKADIDEFANRLDLAS